MGKTHFDTPAGSGYEFAWLLHHYLPGQPVGNIFFVHSGTGTNSTGRGRSPEAPLASLDYAIGLCAANNDDVIIALPGHVETVSAAGGLDLDVAGITLIGLGRGTAQAKIDFTTSALADMDVDAANVTIVGFNFEASFADIAAAVDVNATDCTIKGCRFTSPTTDENAVIWILGAATTVSNRLTVEDCDFFGKDAANTHAISLPGTSDACKIARCNFHVFAETGVIGAAGAVTNILIRDCLIQNSDTDADACILLAANSTGIVAYNGVGAALAGDVTTNISCGSGVVLIQNYSVDTGDRQGVLDPVAT